VHYIVFDLLVVSRWHANLPVGTDVVARLTSLRDGGCRWSAPGGEMRKVTRQEKSGFWIPGESLITLLNIQRGRPLPQEPEFPDGKLIRRLQGGTDSLKGLLLDLRKYSFSGYVRTTVEGEGGVSDGYIVVKAGNPDAAVHVQGAARSLGKAALRRIWEDTAKDNCNIEVHARVNVNELLERTKEALIDRGRKGAESVTTSLVSEKRMLEQKLEVWRRAGYEVTSVEEALREQGEGARQAFEEFEALVKKVEVLGDILDSLDGRGFESEVSELREKLKDPGKHAALEAEIGELQEKVEKRRKDESRRSIEEKREREINERARQVFEMIVKHKVAEGRPLEGLTEGRVREAIESRAAVSRDEATNLISQYTFETFVVGPSNRFANAAAMAVAKSPHEAYNPLFITSGPGLGKTHLLNAIGNRVREGNKAAKILFTSTEGFGNEFKEALQDNSLPAFRDKFRNLDVLLIDDVHFLSGKGDMQEELFHTFNALYNGGKQVALTSDRPPKDIPELEDRLVSRFESGLIADIQAPDFETRLAILKRRAKDAGASVDPEVLSHIAHVVESNIRELGGALNRVVAFSSLMGQTVSLALAKEVLKDLAPDREERRGKPSLDQIMRELKPGRSYLVEEERAVNVFRLFTKVSEGRGTGLVVTRANPKRVRERYGLRSERVLWLTDRESTSEETMPPTLERLIYTVEEFMKVGGKGAVMLDGIEYLVSNNSFESVLRFIRRLVDHFSESQFVLLLSLSPKTMKEQEVKILEREMEVVSF